MTPSARRWGDLPTRLASAAILAPLALYCLWVGGWPWALLLGAAAFGLATEWIALNGHKLVSPAGLCLVVCALAVWVMAVRGSVTAGTAFALLAGPVVWQAGRKKPRAVSLALGLPYIGFGTVALVWLRAMPVSGLANVLVLLGVVWASDVGAYVVGRTIGGAKLAPAISPGKTRSGAIGGLAASCLVGVGAAYWLGLSAASIGWLLPLVLVLSAISQAGDLAESAIKRHFGVKDSGWLIPGHGGLFDRLDGLLAAAPAAAALAFAIGRGVVVTP